MLFYAVFFSLLVGACAGALAVFAVLRGDQLWASHQGTTGDAEASVSDQGHPVLPSPAVDVLSLLPSAHVVVGREGAIVTASPAAYSYGLVRARKTEPPRIADKKLMRLVEGVLNHGKKHEARVAVRKSETDASETLINLRMGPLGSDAVLMLADDVSYAARVEATRRDFVANVSHELKTPVGAITLLAETMEDAAEDPEAVRRFASRMQTEGSRLSGLVQEIIELSRVQGTSALTDAEPVQVDALIADAVALNATAAESAQMTINVGALSSLRVYGSPSLLRTALSNLVANAIAYSDPGGSVGVSARRRKGMVEIAVKDEGIGISAEDLERVFERFYRVDQARSRATGGTGLGLAIVKHIAADHGGEVTVWSAEGHGSTFVLKVPEMGTTEHENETGVPLSQFHVPTPPSPSPAPASERTS